MRAVIQRVSRARVLVEGRVTGEIDAGLVVLVAVGREDSSETPAAMARKIVHLRIFDDEVGQNESLAFDMGGAVLAVSQFTLYGDARGQRRPSFLRAAPPDKGKSWIRRVRARVGGAEVRVEMGVFQAHMSVEIVNDGPVTILLDSDKAFLTRARRLLCPAGLPYAFRWSIR